MTEEVVINIAERREKARGRVIKLSQIPFGFFDEEILKFFSQFGTVKRVRVPRSKKGKFKEHAFVYFSDPDVAKIAAESMDNYLMFEKRVRSIVLADDKIPSSILMGARLIKTEPQANRAKKALAARMNQEMDDEKKQQFKEKLANTIDKSLERLQKAGYKYKFAFRHKM